MKKKYETVVKNYYTGENFYLVQNLKTKKEYYLNEENYKKALERKEIKLLE